MYEIRLSGAKGLGVFAKSFIPRGTRIFSERPLLGIQPDQDAGDIYAASNLLSVQDRQRLMKLSAHITKELSFLRWSQAIWYKIKRTASSIVGRPRVFQAAGLSLKDHVTILSIFRSNAFNLGNRSPMQQAVFRRISRMNHSCVPNSQGNFHETLGSLNVHATRDIQVGEELTLNYLQEEGAARESRQSRLLSGYGFTCDCQACDMTSFQGRLGEQNRLQMHQKLAAFTRANEGNGNSIAQQLDVELQTIQSFILLLEGERIAGRELSTL
jgi:hypothetical protein